MIDLLTMQLEELWKLEHSAGITGLSLEEFIQKSISDTRYTTHQGKHLLKETDFDTVFYSRTYPVISHEDRKKMGEKTVLFLGCSTNSPVATALLQQGLKHFILADPDIIELSNTNRIIGAGIAQLGVNKAEHLNAYLQNIHPYISTTVYTHRLSEQELEASIKEADMIVEMVDDPATKLTTRLLARKHTKPVVMITGIGDQPIVVVEQPEDHFFHRFPQNTDLSMFFKTDISVQERFRLFCTIIGPKYIPPAVMVNMILAAKGKRMYIGQHGGTAMIAGGLGAFAVRELLCGRDIHREVPIDLNGHLAKPESVLQAEQALWEELKLTYPEIFRRTDANLRSALTRLASELFVIEY